MFINRISELNKLGRNQGKLAVIFGRRRVGKTALVLEYQRTFPSTAEFYYSQAIEGSESLQVSQICEEIKPLIPDVPIHSWKDFFTLLSKFDRKALLVIDEFPYLVKTQPSLPSMMQKWLDHQCPEGVQLILLGSSQTMMHDVFLKSSSPLYERASEIMQIRPLGYHHFCEAKSLDPLAKESYLAFSIVGGIPKYWEYIHGEPNILTLTDELYFEVGSRLENEPDRLLKDENIVGERASKVDSGAGGQRRCQTF